MISCIKMIQSLFMITITAIISFFSFNVLAQDLSPGSSSDPMQVPFWLEPSGATVIGMGQQFNIFAAHMVRGSEFPEYIDTSTMSWLSSNYNLVSVDSSGLVKGVYQGSATVQAIYRSFAVNLSVTVSGEMKEIKIKVPGQGIRSYQIYIPAPTMTGSAVLPLLVSMHGGGGSAQEHAAKTLLNKMASQNQMYVVYPEGSGSIQTFNGGNCCGYARDNNIDDVAFIKAVIADVKSRYKIANSKTFVSGFSNGAIMSHRIACAMSDQVDGIITVSGGSGQFVKSDKYKQNPFYDCNLKRPIPIIEVHAKNDRNYPFDGGFGNGYSGTDFYPVESTRNDWIKRNNVLNKVTSTQKFGASTTCSTYDQALNPRLPSAPVILCVEDPVDMYDPKTEIVFGGGHSWPQGVRSVDSKSDVPLQDFDLNHYFLTKMINKSADATAK